MPTDPKESSFMVAAEVQIDKLVRANRWQRALLAVVVVVVVLLGWVVWRQHQEANAACQSGNSYKHSDDQIWNYFIGVLVQNSKDPSAAGKAQVIENHIAQLDAPRDCASSWNLLSEGS